MATGALIGNTSEAVISEQMHIGNTPEAVIAEQKYIGKTPEAVISKSSSFPKPLFYATILKSTLPKTASCANTLQRRSRSAYRSIFLLVWRFK